MSITFTLDGETVTADADQTIWQVAKIHGKTIPHLCHCDQVGYRADGNCRACMVEIEGERTLAASCVRKPSEGMVVHSASARAENARKTVMELLLADQPPRDHGPAPNSKLWQWADTMGVEHSPYPNRDHAPWPDISHPAMAVNLDSCISCGLCQRACREVQVNDVIGMAQRGAHTKVVFDQDDALMATTCVACGECVQVCPTGALLPKAPHAFDHEVASVCPYCGVGCQISYKVKNNRIAWVDGRDGPANQQRLCVKGRFGLDYPNHPQRLTTPLIRKAGAPKGMNVDPANPLTHFHQASWDEALDLAASGLRDLTAQHGGAAVAGFGSAKGSNEEAYLFQKLIRIAFGHNNVDHCTRLCHASSVAALMEGIGSGAVTAPFTEIEHADAAILIGCNPAGNHPVAASYFKQAAKRDTKLIVMDPRGHALKRHATHMVQFRPGADVAMLNAIMNVIIAEGLCDDDYIAAHTTGFDELATHLAPFTPQAMAPICGIDAQTLRQVARTFATAKSAMIFWGMGVSQHTHGTDNARCLIALALITGNVGRAGTGLHPLRGQNNVQGASDNGLVPMFLPDYQPVDNAQVRAKFETLWGTPINPEPGLTVTEIVDAIGETVRGMYIMGENPAMSDPDLNHVRKQLAKLDHLVVQDIFLTETAMFADIILPATAWPEKTGTVTNTNRQIQMGRQAVNAPGEAKADWWIIIELAKRLGLNFNYTHPKEVFAEMTQCMASLANISWERLDTEDAVTYPCASPNQPGAAIVFGDGFPTSDGKAKLVPAHIIAPAEVPDDEFPLILTTGRQLEHWHTGTMTRRAPVLDALEPAANASFHPTTLKQLGIPAGDLVRISTRRGAITTTARADKAVAEGMIFVPFAYVEAAANILTNPKLDPFGKIPEFKFCAAKAEKA